MTSKTTLHFSGAHDNKIVGDAYGDERACPVLLLHGGGQTRHSWGDTGQHLANQGFRAICLDARGHGDSDWDPEGRYLFEDFSADLDLVIQELPRRPVLVGASLGGFASLLYSGEFPERVEALVLVDIAPTVQLKGVRRILSFMSRHGDGFASLEEVADAVAQYMPRRKRPPTMGGLQKNVRLSDDGRYYWHWDPAFLKQRPESDAKARGEEIKNNMLSASKRLTMPALLVRGRFSDVIVQEDVDRFLQLVPHAEFVDVKEAGHMVAGDNNDVFTDAIAEFLGRNSIGG